MQLSLYNTVWRCVKVISSKSAFYNAFHFEATSLPGPVPRRFSKGWLVAILKFGEDLGEEVARLHLEVETRITESGEGQGLCIE